MEKLPMNQNINIVAIISALIVVGTDFGLPVTPQQKIDILVLVGLIAPTLMAGMHTFVNHPANEKKAAAMMTKAVNSVKGKSHVLALFFILAILIFSGALTACTSVPPITTNPTQTAANAVIPGTVISGLQNAAWNLDQAVAIKVLASNDPADLCVHGALQAIGQDVGQAPVATEQFTPKVSDLISAGSVAYILAQQAKTLAGNGGLAVPPSCEQLVGHFVLSGVNAPANAIINGALRSAP